MLAQVGPTGRRRSGRRPRSHILRFALQLVLGVPEAKIRVIAPDVGGGFGSKLNVYAEAARDRAREASRASSQSGRGTLRELRRDDSRARRRARAHVRGDEGREDHGRQSRRRSARWVRTSSSSRRNPAARAWIYNGPYDIPNYSVTVHGRLHAHDADGRVSRGRTARGDVRPRTDDGSTRRRARDRPGGASPQELHHGVPGPARLGPDDRLRRLPRLARPAAGAPRPRLDPEGAGRTARSEGREAARRRLLDLQRDVRPRPVSNPRSDPLRRRSWDSATIRVQPLGSVQVVTGTSPHGQSHETTWAQIVADQLGVPIDDIEVLHGDTAVSSSGWTRTAAARSQWAGSRSSRSEKIVDKAREIAGHQLEVSGDDLEFVDGTFRVKGLPTRDDDPGCCVPGPRGAQPAGRHGAGSRGHRDVRPPNFSWPAGRTRRGRGRYETGDTRLVRYVAVDDVGAPVNPMIVDGQVHGGSRRESPPRSTRRASTTRTEPGDDDDDHVPRPVGEGAPVVRDRPHQHRARRTRSG